MVKVKVNRKSASLRLLPQASLQSGHSTSVQLRPTPRREVAVLSQLPSLGIGVFRLRGFIAHQPAASHRSQKL